MTKEQDCTGCGSPATLTRSLPLCSRCGLAVAEEVMGFVFAGLRGGAGTIELPAAAAPVMSPGEADDVAHQRLASLRKKGLRQVTYRDFKDLAEITGRSRPWVYRWLDDRVKGGDLIKDTSPGGGISYTLTY